MLNLTVDCKVKDDVPSRNMSEFLSIGKLAATAGVRAGTIRYYEQVGLLPKPARTAAGYRQYRLDVAHRLAVIRNAQAFGFSLREIAAFLRVRDGGGKPCENVRDAARRMLVAVDSQIVELRAKRRQMLGTLRLWDQRLAQTPAGSRAHLLETLREPRVSPRRPRPLAR
jgi:MerR family Zn(II)-responsive transcriptional regulator of zntA